MANQFFTIDDFQLEGKKVLVRADINCPYNESTKQIEDSERIVAHSNTIKELSEKNAKVIVLAHQGREGEKDFLPLEQHASLLSKHSGKKVEFIDDLYGEKAIAKINEMANSQIILLQNTRFYDEETKKFENTEEYSKTQMVRVLSKLVDYFINDAFSVSHRSQTSIVGFPQVLPAAAGRVMQRELEGLQKALDKAEHPNVYILGGAKPDDVFKLLKFACTSTAIDKVLTAGVLGELCIIARGIDLGEAKNNHMKHRQYDKLLPELKELITKYSSKIETPRDFAVEENGTRAEFEVREIAQKANGKQTFDIGERTIERYKRIISTAKTLYFKGPVGVYEQPLFEKGTKELLLAFQDANAFKLIGGGHSLSAIEKFSIDKAKISHISLAGGAVVEYLQGKELPGVEALKNAFERDKNKFP